MSFARSPSGLANYHLFYDVNHVVYVEGKKECDCSEDEVIHDIEYYSVLLSSLRPDRTFKVKAVGNCADVIDHLCKVDAAGDRTSFGFVDKDWQGILSQAKFGSLRVITTDGYSWENDLWSVETVKRVFGQLSLAKASVISRLEKIVRNGIRRLGIVSRLDYALQPLGHPLFKKNGASCGFAVDSKTEWGVRKSEISRLLNDYRSGPAYGIHRSNAIIAKLRSIPAHKLIQGHLLSSFFCRVISDLFRKVFPKATLASAVVINTALSVFKNATQICLGKTAYNYYGSSLARLI